jgi:hypothetical protein
MSTVKYSSKLMKCLKNKYTWLGTICCLILGLITFVYIDAYSGNKFRTMQDNIANADGVDLRGLENLHISGGNVPRYPALKWNLRNVNMNKMVVNAETRGLKYIKGLPLTLFGYSYETPLLRHYIRRLLLTGSLGIRPDLVHTEAEEAKIYGLNYKNVVIGSKFTASDDKIEEIINFFDNLPDDTWLHFHCAHGSGRTSMLIVMLDVMKNAPQVALKDIVKRQYLLGSVDLFDTQVWKHGHYTQAMLDNRKKFIEDFYDFICQRKEGGIQSWTEWHQLQKQKEGPITPVKGEKPETPSDQSPPEESLEDI